MLVAVSGDAVVGMALAVLSPVSPFISFQVVHVDYLHVRQGYERRGVGKALLAAATAYADEVGLLTTCWSTCSRRRARPIGSMPGWGSSPS